MTRRDERRHSDARRGYVSRALRAQASLLALTLVCGCLSDSTRETAPVHGSVTFKGRPLERGVVLFTPAVGSGARGEIQSDGTFVLATADGGDRLPVGMYKVAIVALESADIGVLDPEAPVRSIVPERYSSDATSGLEFQVEAGRDNDARFTLSAK